MFFLEVLPFIKSYLDFLQKTLIQDNTQYRLPKAQLVWLGFCLMGILLTNSVAWAKFERSTFGLYTKHAFSFMFRHSKISWNQLLIHSVRAVLKKYGIKKGVLVVDDKDVDRSKNARYLHALHKIKDKKTGGYFLGQNIVFLYLVSETFCIPLSFAFYQPDPVWNAWKKEDQRLKKQKVAKKDRPREPARSKDHLKKFEIAAKLLREFAANIPDFTVTAVLADALYGNSAFIADVQSIWPDVQIITQLRKNQNLKIQNKIQSCDRYFTSYKGWEHKIYIRGHKEKKVEAGGARAYVCSQKAKRFVIALKYQGEKAYRYLLATNLSWNMTDIMQAYTLRWLVEVFFEDWSCYSGFCSMAKQCGKEGSKRPLILSLLFDHCFLFHYRQELFIKNKLPLMTFGSLIEKSRLDALYSLIINILDSDEPKQRLHELVEAAEEVFEIRASRKHMNAVKPTFEKRSHLAA